MGATLDLYIDTQTGDLLQSGAAANGSLPTLTRNDSYTLRLRLLEKQPDGTFDDIDYTGGTLKAAIGAIEDDPTDGAFKLSCNGTTSSEIPYNTTAISLYSAISNNVSTVAIYGGQFLLTATQPNTAMSFAADSFTLFPASTVVVGTRRTPTAGVYAQQTVRLQQNPAVFADTFITSPTTSEIVLTKLQDGSATLNESYELSIGNAVRGGSFALVFGANATTAIAIGTSAVSAQVQLGAVTGIGASNISVQENGKGGYAIQFAGAFKLTNITTPLTLDASNISFIPFQQTTLSLNTSELSDYFANAGEDSITPTLEIELSQNGTPKTILQQSITIRKDLITSGSVVPSTGELYYSAIQSDARFVSRIGDVGFYATTPISKPSSTSVVSALVSLGLISSSVTLNEQGGSFPTVALTGSAITVTDAINFVLGSSTGSKFGTATTQKLAFYNSTAIVQPTSTNVVSALVSLGLVASSVTLGVPSNVVTDWSGNISATTRSLIDSSAVTSVDWQNRVLKNSSGVTAVNWQTGAFGTGLTVVTIASTNVAITSSYYVKFGDDRAFKTLSTTAALNFGAIAANSSSILTATVTGVVANDVVLLGLPTAICAGLSFIASVTTTNTAQITALNVTTSSITQSSQTYRITALNYQ